MNVPIGLGTGGLFAAMGLGVQASCDPALNAQAAAFYSFARTFGQSIGVAVSGVIFQNSFRNKLLAIPAFANLADQYSHDATAVVEMIKQMPASASRSQLVQAYSDSLRSIWISMIAFSAFCLLLSLTIKSYSLEQDHVTNQALVQDVRPNSESGSDVEAGHKTEKS